MASERLRLLAAALVFAGAGALAQASGASARAWTGAATLAAAGLALAWPLGQYGGGWTAAHGREWRPGDA